MNTECISILYDKHSADEESHLERGDNRPEDGREEEREEPEEGREDEDDHLKVDTINIVRICAE